MRNHLLFIFRTWQIIQNDQTFSPYQNNGHSLGFENVTMCHKDRVISSNQLFCSLMAKRRFMNGFFCHYFVKKKFHEKQIAEKLQTCFDVVDETKRKVRCHFNVFFANSVFTLFCQFLLSFVCLLTPATDFFCAKSFRKCTMIQQKACIWICVGAIWFCILY